MLCGPNIMKRRSYSSSTDSDSEPSRPRTKRRRGFTSTYNDNNNNNTAASSGRSLDMTAAQIGDLPIARLRLLLRARGVDVSGKNKGQLCIELWEWCRVHRQPHHDAEGRGHHGGDGANVGASVASQDGSSDIVDDTAVLDDKLSSDTDSEVVSDNLAHLESDDAGSIRGHGKATCATGTWKSLEMQQSQLSDKKPTVLPIVHARANHRHHQSDTVIHQALNIVKDVLRNYGPGLIIGTGVAWAIEAEIDVGEFWRWVEGG